MLAPPIPTTVHPDTAADAAPSPAASSPAAVSAPDSPSGASLPVLDPAADETGDPQPAAGASLQAEQNSAPGVAASPECALAGGDDPSPLSSPAAPTPQPAAAGFSGGSTPAALNNDHFASAGYQAHQDGIPRDGHGMVSKSQVERWVAGWDLAARQAERVKADG